MLYPATAIMYYKMNDYLNLFEKHSHVKRLTIDGSFPIENHKNDLKSVILAAILELNGVKMSFISLSRINTT